MILDATEAIMVEEGYAAVSTRRVAQQLGLNAATVHYYYPTTDDLFTALHRRMTERQLGEMETVLASDDPLAVFWKIQSGWAQTALGVEFLALSNHRKAICEELAVATEAARQAQAELLERSSGGFALDRGILPPIAVVTMIVALGRLLANEERVGVTRGHDEVRTFVDWAIRQLVVR